MKKFKLLILILCLGSMISAQVTLVKDIIPGAGSTFLDSSQAGIAFNGNYIFAANGPEGNELWISDGTSDGTIILKDIHSTESSHPDNFLIEFGRVYFAATSSEFGRELWMTDGTSNGTVMVSDIAQGIENSDPNLGGRLGDYMYFGATGGPEGHELWRVDSSNQVTFFMDVNTFNSSWPRAFTRSGEVLFFAANALDVTDPNYDEDEPFVTDGTVEGTKQIANVTFHPDGADVRDFTPFKGNTYFLADFFGGLPATRHLLYVAEENGDNTYEFSPVGGNQWLMQVGDYLVWILGDDLYSYDGLFDFPIAKATNPAGYSDPTPGVTFGNKLAFPAEDPDEATGIELYITNGTFEGNGIASDIYPGAGSSDPRHLVSFDGKVYFAASPNDTNRELFVSDGSSTGTYMVADINPGPEGSNPTALTVVDSVIYFYAYAEGSGYELYKFDPQTNRVNDFTKVQFEGRVFPQPASGNSQTIHVELNVADNWETASLHDIQGRLIVKYDINSTSDLEILPGTLQPGIYTLQVSNKLKFASTQLSVQ